MSDYSKIAFDSAQRLEHIATKSHFDFSVVGPTGFHLYTIAHNLGYAPYFKAFYTYGDGKYFDLFAGPASFNIDGNGGQIDSISVDATNLYVGIDANNAGTLTGTVYYRIYAEPQ